jgi:AAA domain
MRISKITIKNILGLEALEIDRPGPVTVISGANGTGKTSVLDAIRCALSGGTDATLLHAGAESGEAVLVLDDGTEIQRRVTADGSNVTVNHPQYGRIGKPAAFLKKLADALSLNPISFLSAPKKERVDQLLAAIPMTVTAEQLAFVPMMALDGINLDGHALEVLGRIGKTLFDLRTGVNRAEREKRSTVNQMSENLPAGAPEGDWGDVLSESTREYTDLQKRTRLELSAIEKAKAAEIEIAVSMCSAAINNCKSDLEIAIEKLRAAAQIQMDAVREESNTATKRAEATAKEKIAIAESEYRPKEADLKEKIGQAKAMAEEHAKAETTRQHIAQWSREADKLGSESEGLTAALSKLEVLKASLLQKLPIEGLEIKDGDLFIGGISFDRVNTSKRVRLAVEVAKLRAGNLPLICCDGLECLDEKTFAAFKKAAAESDLQFVISKVSEGPLSIETSPVSSEERAAILEAAI